MRLELNKRTDLAMRAMHELCLRETRVSGSELAVALDTTRQYLPQIMNPLVKADWVRSTPGPHGGYELKTPLEQVSVIELVETMEGPTVNSSCVLGGQSCPRENLCALHVAWRHARTALIRELGEMSLADAWASV